MSRMIRQRHYGGKMFLKYVCHLVSALYDWDSIRTSKKQYKFYNKSMWKNVHPVYSAGIRTHNLSNISRHP